MKEKTRQKLIGLYGPIGSLKTQKAKLSGLIPDTSRGLKYPQPFTFSHPSHDLALALGVADRSYPTPFGKKASFSGKAVIHTDDGCVWIAEGHRSRGDSLGGNGWIEFRRIL